MGFELKSIDVGNTDVYICSPELEVAENAISTIFISEILEINNGYTRKDLILTIKLEKSIQNEDETYPLKKNMLYEFINNTNIKYFRIIDFYENSGITIIKLYGERNQLTDFFGSLESKILNNYKMEIYDSFKVSELDVCNAPTKVDFFSVTNSSIKIKPLFDFIFIESWVIRYRVNGTIDWTTINNITNPEYELKNLNGNTLYQTEILVKCNINSEYSDFSETFLFKTI